MSHHLRTNIKSEAPNMAFFALSCRLPKRRRLEENLLSKRDFFELFHKDTLPSVDFFRLNFKLLSLPEINVQARMCLVISPLTFFFKNCANIRVSKLNIKFNHSAVNNPLLEWKYNTSLSGLVGCG